MFIEQKQDMFMDVQEIDIGELDYEGFVNTFKKSKR